MGALRVGTKPGEKISFSDWLDRLGIAVVARRLGIREMTVRNWRAGKCDPRVDQMRRIKRISDGEMDYDQMIDRPVMHSKVRGNYSRR